MLYKVATAILDELPFGGLITSLLDCIKDGKAKGEDVDEKLRVLDEGLSDWVESIEVANNVRTMVEKFRDDIRMKQQDRKELGEEAASNHSDSDRQAVNDTINIFEQEFEQNQRSLLGNLVERIKKAIAKSNAKENALAVDDVLKELVNVLTEWLEAVSGQNAMNPVGELQTTVKDFHEFVDNMITHRKERLMNTFRNNQDNEKLDSKISASKEKIQFSVYRLIASTFLLASQTHVEVVRIGKMVDEIRAIFKDFQQSGVELSADEISEIELMMNMYKGDGTADDRNKLMHSFSEKPANERLKLALLFIRLVDDDIKLMGLLNLELLHQEDLNGFVIDDAVIHLIELARDVNEKVKVRASAILKMVAEKDELKAQFFKRVRVLCQSEANKQAIVETIADLIVDCARKVRNSKRSRARKVRNSKSGRARNAFDALRMLMKTESCRLAIAKAGGISALAEIYKGTTDLIRITEENPKSNHTRGRKKTNKQAIDALIVLARNDESRRYFASETIWTLIHYIDAKRDEYYPIADFLLEDGELITEDHIVPVNQSNQQRVQDAGEALWQLSLIDEFKSVIISLSKVDTSCSLNDIASILRNATAGNCFDDLHSWTKRMRDMDKAICVCDRVRKGEYGNDTKRTKWSQRELFSTIYTSFRNLLWSLILDGETAVAVAACWYDTRPENHQLDYMENVDRRYCEYWVTTVLHHINHPEKKSCKKVSRCLKLLLKKLDDSNTSVEHKERTAKVLWFCSLAKTINEKNISSSFSKVVGDVVERCKKLIDAGTPAQIFWATGILANVAWSRSSPQDAAAAAVKGAQYIVANGFKEFAFVARYVADNEPGLDVSIENEGLYFDSNFYDDLHERKQNAADGSSSDGSSSDGSSSNGRSSDGRSSIGSSSDGSSTDEVGEFDNESDERDDDLERNAADGSSSDVIGDIEVELDVSDHEV